MKSTNVFQKVIGLVILLAVLVISVAALSTSNPIQAGEQNGIIGSQTPPARSPNPPPNPTPETPMPSPTVSPMPSPQVSPTASPMPSMSPVPSPTMMPSPTPTIKPMS